MSGDDHRAGSLRASRRLIVMLPTWVGDTVMATPVLRALRSSLPEAHIVALCRPGLGELLAGALWLDDVIVAGRGGAMGPFDLAALLRSRHPDAILLLPNSFRSALTARMSGAAVRSGYARDGRGWLLTHALAAPGRGEPISAIDYYARLAEWALDLPAIERRTELVVTDAERSAANDALAGVDRPFALLNPGASKAAKRWPIERFAAVADGLSRRHGLAVVASGSLAEIPLLDALASAAVVPILNLARRGLTLGPFKAVASRGRIMITNDTGPRHIAIALGRPVVSLFGPTDHRWTATSCDHEHVLRAEPFLPEELMADRHPRACAIERIPVSDVLAAAERLLERGAGASTASRGNRLVE